MKNNITSWLLEELMSDKYVQQAAVKSYEPGGCIFKTGDPGDYLGILLSGKIEIRKKGKSVAIEEVGSMFGEMGLIDRQPRAADVQALSHCRILEVREGQFMALLNQNAHFSLCVMRILTERLRSKMDS